MAFIFENWNRMWRVATMSEWWPYGGSDLCILSLATLLRNAPPRPEALEACSASKVVRTLQNMPAVLRVALKVLFWFGLVVFAPIFGIFFACIFSLGAVIRGKPVSPVRAVKMAVFRCDCFAYPILEDWQRPGTPFDVLAQAMIHFSEVDLHRMYSLFVRAAHHLIDVYNCPKHGAVQDKLTFYAMCKERGLPCAAPLTPDDIAKLQPKDFPLFMKPSNEQEAVGAKVVEVVDDPDLQRAVTKAEDWVVQKKLRNCDFLREYFPENPPLCGVRITTVMTKEGPEVLESWIRVGAKDAVADCPFSAGGCEFAIFSETGEVWQGSDEKHMKDGDSSLEPSVTVANGATRAIKGVRIPWWEESVAMCKKAHVTMAKEAFTIGWDVAHTPDGPLMVEANLISNVGCFMGLRYGSMALVWPRIPLMWLDLADWMEGKSDWPSCSAKAKRAGMKAVVRKSEELARQTRDTKACLEKRIEALKAKDPEGACPSALAKLETQLRLRKGELKGLGIEIKHIKARLAKAAKGEEKGKEGTTNAQELADAPMKGPSPTKK